MVRKVIVMALCFVVAVVQAPSPRQVGEAMGLLSIQEDPVSSGALAEYAGWDAAGSNIKIENYAVARANLVGFVKRFKSDSKSQRKKAILVLLEALDDKFLLVQQRLEADRKVAETLALAPPTPRADVSPRRMPRGPVHRGPVRAVHTPASPPKIPSRSSSRSSSRSGPSVSPRIGSSRPRGGSPDALSSGLPRPRSGLRRASSASRLTPRTQAAIDASLPPSPRTQAVIDAALLDEERVLLSIPSVPAAAGPRRPHRLPPLAGAGGQGATGSPRRGLERMPRARSTPRLSAREIIPSFCRPIEARGYKKPVVSPNTGFSTIGFYCDTQTGLTCGFNSVCNAIALINAANSPGGSMYERLMNAKFLNNAGVREKKDFFDAMAFAGMRSDELTGSTQLNKLFNYFFTGSPLPVGFGIAALPPEPKGVVVCTYANFPVSGGCFENVEHVSGLFAELRRSGLSDEGIVTELNKLSGTVGAYRVASARVNGVAISSRMFDRIRQFQAIREGLSSELDKVNVGLASCIQLINDGRVVVWCDLSGGGHIGHWRCKCLFKHVGKVYLGVADSLAPGRVSISEEDKKLIAYLGAASALNRDLHVASQII